MSTACLAVVYFISILVYSQYAIFYKYHCSFLCILYNIMLYKLDKSEITLTFAMFTFIILIESKSDYTCASIYSYCIIGIHLNNYFLMLYPEIFIDVDFDIDFYIEDTVISYSLAISIFLIYRSN